MTTPDTLASLIAKMDHAKATFTTGHIEEHEAVCDKCKLEDALDALAEKWEKEAGDDYSNDYVVESANEQLRLCAAELRGRGKEPPVSERLP